MESHCNCNDHTQLFMNPKCLISQFNAYIYFLPFLIIKIQNDLLLHKYVDFSEFPMFNGQTAGLGACVVKHSTTAVKGPHL